MNMTTILYYCPARVILFVIVLLRKFNELALLIYVCVAVMLMLCCAGASGCHGDDMLQFPVELCQVQA